MLRSTETYVVRLSHFFFFSSRRRHTRLVSDWSSDVCSSDLVDAILDAAARILVDRGYDAFTTNRVAAGAGVSVGSLYQYFPNKEALLAELKIGRASCRERV